MGTAALPQGVRPKAPRPGHHLSGRGGSLLGEGQWEPVPASSPCWGITCLGICLVVPWQVPQGPGSGHHRLTAVPPPTPGPARCCFLVVRAPWVRTPGRGVEACACGEGPGAQLCLGESGLSSVRALPQLWLTCFSSTAMRVDGRLVTASHPRSPGAEQADEPLATW